MSKYLIIGASGDIGSAITKSLIQEGHDLIIHHNETPIEQLQSKFKPMDGQQSIQYIKIDLSISIEENPFHHALDDIDGVIYVAGMSSFQMVQDITSTLMYEQFHIHYFNLVKIIQFSMSGLLQSENGRIIVISSIWGETGASLESLYSSMKSAQIGLVKSLAKELALTHITVNAVTPGLVDGHMTNTLDAEDVKALLEEIPQGQLIQPDKIAHTVQYLLHPNASNVTGTIQRVNAGWLI